MSVHKSLAWPPQEGEEIEEGSGKIPVVVLHVICEFDKLAKMNPSSLSLIMTHFPGQEKRGGAGKTEGG